MGFESPRQPHNIDPIDESSLALLGERIETWEAAGDESVPMAERRSKLWRATVDQANALKVQLGEGEDSPELEILTDDLLFIAKLPDDEREIAEKIQQRVAYYKQTRAEFIAGIE